MSLIKINKINKTYKMGQHVVHALQDISLEIGAGEFSAIVGPSGSGKSTLMNIIGCIDRPDSGTVKIDGEKLNYQSLSKLSKFRAKTLGFIFQSFNLIPVLNVFENIEYPLLLSGTGFKERKKRVEEISDKVGLLKFLAHKPNELSGGQKQRVAIARSLINKPKVVLADEPTASLDTGTSDQILQLMKELNDEDKTTFLITTHDPLVRTYTSREIIMKDGKVLESEMELA